jgi:arylsulfatase/uncharacterized sulfatase
MRGEDAAAMIRISCLTAGLTVGLAAACLGGAATAQDAPERPNIVLIILDDVGLTDLGVTGGEAATPAMDALAGAGVVFANFNTAPMCAPSRAMMLTGVVSHDAGVANLPETTPDALEGLRGYEGRLTRRAATLAEHLRPAGYQTFISGKWHLGHDANSLPTARGFDRSFVLDASGADNWQDRPYLAYYDRAEWWADGAPARRPDGMFSSTFLVDQMLDYLGRRDPGRPFFAVIGFQAVHIPVQAPRDIVEAYNGVYDSGWDVLAARRHAGAAARGLIPADAAAPATPNGLRDWAGLDDETRAFVTASMEVNAAMLDATDREIARLVARLREEGVYDNTLFLIVSDNGPEHNRPDLHRGTEFWLDLVGYSRDPATLGGPETYAWIGPEWAKAAAGHGAFFKMHAGSGGMNVPLIVSGPGVSRRGVARDFAFATDLVPTVLDYVGAAPVPADIALAGRSLVPLLSGPDTAPRLPDTPVGMEAGGHAALFLGPLKLVRNITPYGDGAWRLFDWTADPGETLDLAAARPEEFEQMMEAWEIFAALHAIQPVAADYTPADLMARRTYARQARKYAPWGLGGFALIGLGIWLVIRRRA